MNRTPIASPLLLVGRDTIETWHGSDYEYREVDQCGGIFLTMKMSTVANRPSHSSRPAKGQLAGSGRVVGNPSVTRPNGQRRVRCGLPVIRQVGCRTLMHASIPRCFF